MRRFAGWLVVSYWGCWLAAGGAELGCVRGAGTRCDRVCRREADCADKLELPDGDFKSCVEACNELERDPQTARQVEAHVRCVGGAESCQTVMDCR